MIYQGGNKWLAKNGDQEVEAENKDYKVAAYAYVNGVSVDMAREILA